MSYGRFRTGDNRPDTEGKEIAVILALEKIAKVLEELRDLGERYVQLKKDGYL